MLIKKLLLVIQNLRKFVNWDKHYVNESYHHIVFLEVKRRAEVRLALIQINTFEFALSGKCPYLKYVP